MTAPFNSIGDAVTRWALIGLFVGATLLLVAWHYGKYLHHHWLNSIPHRHSSRSYGHPHVHNIVRPPYDWKKEKV